MAEPTFSGRATQYSPSQKTGRLHQNLRLEHVLDFPGKSSIHVQKQKLLEVQLRLRLWLLQWLLHHQADTMGIARMDSDGIARKVKRAAAAQTAALCRNINVGEG